MKNFVDENDISIEDIEKIFLDKILPEDFMITELSTLSDFVSMFDVSRSLKHIEGNKYLFKYKIVLDPLSKPFEYEEKETIEEATNEKQEITQKVNEIFGVDITEKFNDPLYEVLHYIKMNKKIEAF